MEEEFMKKTQDTLGKIIKKPPLTEKLLRKPPFRFLHDIFTEVIRTTGFFGGLFTAKEMDSKNVTVKEDKMSFLQKVIDVVVMVSGHRLSVRPSKIVAGHEPEKTNELLQTIARCIRKNLSSDEAVQHIMSGGKSEKIQEKPPTGSSKRREGKENREQNDDSRKKRREKENEREKSSDRRRKSAGKERSRDKESNREQGAGEGNDEREDRHRSSEKSRDRKDRNKDERSRDRKEKKRQEDPDENPDQEELEDLGKNRGRSREDENDDQEEEDKRDSSATGSSRPPRPASAKGHRRRPGPDRGSKESTPDGQPEKSRSKPARPPSARPAAPRVRQRPDAAEEEIARMESAGRQRTAPIIVDRSGRAGGGAESSSDDEDEQFLVQEEDVQPPEMEKLSPILNGDVKDQEGEEEEGEHGGLVRKILETKKELETSAAKGTNLSGKKRVEIKPAVNEAQRRKERELVVRDINNLRASVQKLCRSAMPLGKIIDYIQEDMDSMQNELIQWKKENKEQAAKLKEEESITTKTIEPLKTELEELDRSIAAQLDMIATSKCNVLRNQEKIDKMVAGVTARS